VRAGGLGIGGLRGMIATWSEGLADENMAEDILVKLAGIVRRHPW